MKNVFLNSEGKRSLISLNNGNPFDLKSTEIPLINIPHKRNIQLISNSQFPSDFFSSKKEPQTHSTQKDSFLKQNNDVNLIKAQSNLKIHILPKQITQVEAENKTQFHANDIIAFKYDCNYEEDKEMIDLLSGKDNANKEALCNNNAVLIQTLRQKKKTLKKCEIIPEVNESQYMRTRTSQFSTEENEHNSKRFNLKKAKLKGNMTKPQKLMKNSIPQSPDDINPTLPMPQMPKSKEKIAIDSVQRDSSVSHYKEICQTEFVKNVPQSTRNNSSSLRNMNKNQLHFLDNQENNMGPYENQITPLRSTFNSIMTLVNDKDLKEDDTIKQKLKLIMQNISDIKTAIAHKKQKRNNIASAPSNSGVNTPSLKAKRQLNLRQEELPDLILNTNQLNSKEDNAGHYMNYKRNVRKGIVTQRRNQSTAPVKVFSHNKKSIS